MRQRSVHFDIDVNRLLNILGRIITKSSMVCLHVERHLALALRLSA